MGLTADEDQSLLAGLSRGSFSNDVLTLVRVQYDSTGGRGEAWYAYEGRIWQRWETDYPRAELNLIYRLEELTSIEVAPEPLAMRLEDERLFDHPFIFMSDVGWQILSRAEVNRLTEYLQRGGFLWVDDFWGEAEWANFQRNLKGLPSDWTWRDIPDDHPILSVIYPLEKCPQIPARIFFESTGQHYDPPWVHRYPNGGDEDLSQVHLRGLFDAQDQLLAIATHNTDIADGWEREGEDLEYFDKFSVFSYAMAVNVIVYALTH